MNRNWRGYMVWVFTLGLILFVWFSMRTTTVEHDISYSEFKHRLHDNQVESVVIRPDQIRGRSRDAEGKEDNFRTIPLNDPGLVDDMERSKVKEYSGDVDRNWLSAVLLNFGPAMLFLVLWFFMIRQMQGGGKQAMAFGRSKAKLQGAKKTKITFGDVAGCDEAKVELQEIIEFLKDPAKFQRLGGKIPKGVLLYGAPGTGKTLLAKAVAGEAGVPFFSASGSEFVEMFVGVGASRVRDLFDQGRRNAPCLLFIDEIDAVGRQRFAGIGGGHDEREQTLNQLLVEMDGFDTKEGVILIAATNRPDVLDPALLRPGRFDRHITVPRPDLNGREQILNVHAKGIKLGPDVDLRSVARGTPGLVGADLANIINEAALLAARRNKPYVEKAELSEAVERVGSGPERRSLKITDREKRIVAYHESGHALIASLTPAADPVHRVTIIPRGPALGYVRQVPEDRQLHSVSQLKSQIAVALGGREAEEMIFSEVTGGACSDIEKATEMATRMVCEWGMSEKLGPMSFTRGNNEVFMGRDIGQNKSYSDQTAQTIDSEVRRFIMESQAYVKKLLTENRAKLDRLAAQLIERETLDGDELNAILNEGNPSRLPAKLSRFFTHPGWVLGVVNVTSDSFYPASRGVRVSQALKLAARLVSEGADGLDLGAESTRPGAHEITEEEEMRRLLPVIETMRQQFPQVPLSIDTRKAAVARAALRLGAHLINDISALRHDPGMAEVVAQTRSPVILMHMQGTPQTMQRRPRYKNIVDDARSFFEERLRFATRAGIAEQRIVLDPGIGFGKTLRHNLTLLRHLRQFLSLGRPLLIGLSRKSFIGRILGSATNPLPVQDRLEGTLGASLWAFSQGAAGLRTHDVKATRHALTLWRAIQHSA